MKIATFNVNSVKARLPAVTQWLSEAKPDIACLQELKTVAETFPREEIEALGYNLALHGQKSYNGVAVLSRLPFEEVNERLPGNDDDEQARYLEVVVAAPQGPVRVSSIYLPNGNPVFDGEDFHEKYVYKLAWMKRLHAHVKTLLAYEEPLILAGDYNVIPNAGAVHDPALWAGDALYRPQTKAAFERLLWLGLINAYDQADGREDQYSYWDYKAGAWQRNHGIRIDHLLLSAQAADRLKSVHIDSHIRGRERPSDHVPVIGTFEFGASHD